MSPPVAHRCTQNIDEPRARGRKAQGFTIAPKTLAYSFSNYAASRARPHSPLKMCCSFASLLFGVLLLPVLCVVQCHERHVFRCFQRFLPARIRRAVTVLVHHHHKPAAFSLRSQCDAKILDLRGMRPIAQLRPERVAIAAQETPFETYRLPHQTQQIARGLGLAL